MNREDIAWAAGLFEGEGTFSIHNSKGGRYAVAQLGMVDRDVIERLAKIFGGLRVYGPYPTDGQPIYRICTESFEKVQCIIAMVWPWLGERRRSQARRVLAEQTTTFNRRRGRWEQSVAS